MFETLGSPNILRSIMLITGMLQVNGIKIGEGV